MFSLFLAIFSSIRQLLYFKIKFLVFVKSKLKFAYDHLKSNEFRYEKSNYKTKYKAFRQDLKTTFRRSKQAGGSKLFGWAHQNRGWPLKASIGTKKKGREKEKRNVESWIENVTGGACGPAVPHNVCSAALYAPGAGSYIVRVLPSSLPDSPARESARLFFVYTQHGNGPWRPRFPSTERTVVRRLFPTTRSTPKNKRGGVEWSGVERASEPGEGNRCESSETRFGIRVEFLTRNACCLSIRWNIREDWK